MTWDSMCVVSQVNTTDSTCGTQVRFSWHCGEGLRSGDIIRIPTWWPSRGSKQLPDMAAASRGTSVGFFEGDSCGSNPGLLILDVGIDLARSTPGEPPSCDSASDDESKQQAKASISLCVWLRASRSKLRLLRASSDYCEVASGICQLAWKSFPWRGKERHRQVCRLISETMLIIISTTKHEECCSPIFCAEKALPDI